MSVFARPIKTSYFEAGKNLAAFVADSIPKVSEGSVIAITSKIVSLSENRLVPLAGTDRKKLIQQEADQILGEVSHNYTMTLKHGLLIPGAGIDSSNSKDQDFILYPKDPWASAAKLGQKLRAHYKVDQLGILLTDSHSVPLRRGVVGISLAHWGFRAVRDCIGKPDLFGRPLKFTKQNLADGLAGLAVLLMGEANESQPLVVIEGVDLEFTCEDDRQELLVSPENDLYLQLLKERQLKS